MNSFEMFEPELMSAKNDNDQFHTQDLIVLCHDNNDEEYIEEDPFIKTEFDEQQVDEEYHLNDPELDPQFECSSDVSRESKLRYRTTYKVEEKLEAVKHAEESSNRQAAKIFAIDESCIRKWRTQKHQLQKKQINLKQNTPMHSEPGPSVVVIDNTVIEPLETALVSPEMEPQKAPVKTRKAYSSGEKLDAVEYAEVTGNRQAAKVFAIDESCIRKWRQNKELLIEIHRERGTKRKPNLHWPNIDKALKDWAMEQMNQGVRLKPSEIKAKSIDIAKSLSITNFKGTSSYIFKFMLRYHIPGRQARATTKKKKCSSPPSVESSQ